MWHCLYSFHTVISYSQYKISANDMIPGLYNLWYIEKKNDSLLMYSCWSFNLHYKSVCGWLTGICVCNEIKATVFTQSICNFLLQQCVCRFNQICSKAFSVIRLTVKKVISYLDFLLYNPRKTANFFTIWKGLKLIKCT